VHAWRAIPVQRGQMLTLRVAQGGVRAYLCVAGGIDVPEMMGSRSTDLKAGFGGFEGRPLKDGDRLPVLPADTTYAPDISGDTVAVKAARWTFDRAQKDTPVMRVLPGPEYDDFVADAQAAFWESDWTLTPNSNRMGFRLQGPELKRKKQRSGDLLSHGVVPGVIQVPPSGQPIVLMADAQTTGAWRRFRSARACASSVSRWKRPKPPAPTWHGICSKSKPHWIGSAKAFCRARIAPPRRD
jgi:5-oxoprolinase (ATP-hydrolysing) subunit C